MRQAGVDLLGTVFGAAGLVKLRDPGTLRVALAALVPRRDLGAPARLVALLELALSALLLSGVAPRAAALAALAVLLVLSLALLALRRRAPGTPCGCLGAHSAGGGLVRNAVLGLLALALALEPARRGLGEDALASGTVALGLLCAWALLGALAEQARIGAKARA